MKKIINLIFALTMLTTLASCNKSANPTRDDSVSAITIDLSMEADPELSTLTKTSSTTVLTLDNGCTCAFYSKTTGELKTTGTCSGNTRKIIITDVPDCDCYVYAVGNTSFEWPNTESELTSKKISINVITGAYLPCSTTWREYEWTTGTPSMNINMQKMYTRVAIKKNVIGKTTTFTAKSASVLNCPNEIYPFNTSATGTSGTNDNATTTDIQLYNTENYFVLYVPSEGQSKLVLNGTRMNGTGTNYDDTYTLTIPAANLKRNKDFEGIINITGENSSDVLVVVIGTDTKDINFEQGMMNVVGNGINYHNSITGTAGNGETAWPYTISWTGNSDLGNTTYIDAKDINDNPVHSSLGVSGSITLKGDGTARDFSITSTYAGAEKKTVNLIAKAMMDKTTEKTYDAAVINIAPKSMEVTIITKWTHNLPSVLPERKLQLKIIFEPSETDKNFTNYEFCPYIDLSGLNITEVWQTKCDLPSEWSKTPHYIYLYIYNPSKINYWNNINFGIMSTIYDASLTFNDKIEGVTIKYPLDYKKYNTMVSIPNINKEFWDPGDDLIYLGKIWIGNNSVKTDMTLNIEMKSQYGS